MDSRTGVLDDFGIFSFPGERNLQISVDMIVNPDEPGVYFVTIHHITDDADLFGNMVVVNQISDESSTKAIEFTSDYLDFAIREDVESENISTLLYTIFKITLDENGKSVIKSKGFSLMPLFQKNTSPIVGNY